MRGSAWKTMEAEERGSVEMGTTGKNIFQENAIENERNERENWELLYDVEWRKETVYTVRIWIQ